MRGMMVQIYRHADGSDCTNGGISARVKYAVLCGPGLPEIFDARPDMPALRLCSMRIGDSVHYYAVPVDGPADGRKVIGPMFGGNFAYSGDSRVKPSYPIPIHDRWETQADYDALSR